MNLEPVKKGGLESPNYLDVFLVFFLLCQLQIWDHVSANANGDHCCFGAFSGLDSERIPEHDSGFVALGGIPIRGTQTTGTQTNNDHH